MVKLRGILCLVLGVLIGGYAVSAFAEDYPAVASWSGGVGGVYPSASACLSAVESYNSSQGGCGGYGSWERDIRVDSASTQGKCNNGSNGTASFSCVAAFSCPGGGALTYTASGYVCRNAPPCNTGENRDPVTGKCGKPKCPSGQASSGSYDMGTSPGGGPPGYACAGGCPVSFSSSGTCPSQSGDVNGVKHYYCQGSYDYIPGGAVGECNGDPMPGTSEPPKDPSNCPAGQTKVGTRADGSAICAQSDNEQGNCGAGQTQVGTRADGSPICADNNPDKPKQGECGSGQTQVGTRADGSPICNNNGPQQGDCGAGQQQIGTRADGSPLCVANPGDSGGDGDGDGDGTGDDGGNTDPSPDPKTDDEKCEAPKVKDSNGNCVIPPDENCDPATDPNKCQASMPEKGTLWTRQDKTFATVFSDFKGKMMSAPIIQSSQGWINISVPSGSCPDLSVTVPYLNAHISLGEYFCSSAAQNMMNLAGAVLLAVAAFAAFRWAFL